MPDIPDSPETQGMPNVVSVPSTEETKVCSMCGHLYPPLLLKRTLSRVTLVREGPQDDHHWALGVVVACPACYDEFVGFLPSLMKAIQRFTYLKGKSEA